MRKITLAVAAVLTLATYCWPQAFTLEQVLSSPFPSSLTAAKRGSRVAWVFNDKGVRNVWVADGPDYARSAHAVTQYTEDDGQPIASLRLTPDGNTVVYARGTELNGEGESADVDHDVHQPNAEAAGLGQGCARHSAAAPAG
jgi:hypothetical protein